MSRNLSTVTCETESFSDFSQTIYPTRVAAPERGRRAEGGRCQDPRPRGLRLVQHQQRHLPAQGLTFYLPTSYLPMPFFIIGNSET